MLHAPVLLPLMCTCCVRQACTERFDRTLALPVGAVFWHLIRSVWRSSRYYRTLTGEVHPIWKNRLRCAVLKCQNMKSAGCTGGQNRVTFLFRHQESKGHWILLLNSLKPKWERSFWQVFTDYHGLYERFRQRVETHRLKMRHAPVLSLFMGMFRHINSYNKNRNTMEKLHKFNNKIKTLKRNRPLYL